VRHAFQQAARGIWGFEKVQRLLFTKLEPLKIKKGFRRYKQSA
jgi:hypothetical protein